jgi:acyl dehydratase
MSFNLENIGKKTKENTFAYDWKDVILYALGIGAQPDELPFVYEGVKGGLKVFPSFATIAHAGANAMPLALGKGAGNILSRLVHGSQQIKLFRPFKKRGKIVNVGELHSILDKGKNAIINVKVTGNTPEGEPIYETLAGYFVFGMGGFGGDPGPTEDPLIPPEGVTPDFSISYKTQQNQAALYRLNGDFNPLHIDPAFAMRVIKEANPILHGLGTYGFATRAIVYGLCDGDVSRFKEFGARFSKFVYPGDTITTEGWKTNGKYIIQAKTERNVVLSRAYAVVE